MKKKKTMKKRKEKKMKMRRNRKRKRRKRRRKHKVMDGSAISGSKSREIGYNYLGRLLCIESCNSTTKYLEMFRTRLWKVSYVHAPSTESVSSIHT